MLNCEQQSSEQFITQVLGVHTQIRPPTSRQYTRNQIDITEKQTNAKPVIRYLLKSSCSSFKSNLAELYDEEEQEWMWNLNFIDYSKDNINKTWTNLNVALVVKNLPASAGDVRNGGSVPELWRSPGGGHGKPLQYSCWRIPLAGRKSLVGYSPQDCTGLDTT